MAELPITPAQAGPGLPGAVLPGSRGSPETWSGAWLKAGYQRWKSSTSWSLMAGPYWSNLGHQSAMSWAIIAIMFVAGIICLMIGLSRD